MACSISKKKNETYWNQEKFPKNQCYELFCHEIEKVFFFLSFFKKTRK